MTINITKQYIELTKKQIASYMKLVFGRKFNKNYNDLYTEKYINIRYYNYYENDINSTIRRKILAHLKQTEEDISINHIADRELIEQMRIFFYYVLYFDNVVYYKDLRKTIEKIAKLRKKILNKKDDGFEENLYQKMLEFQEKKKELITKFESEEFFLKISNYKDKLNIYRVNLAYKIKFPLEYSEFAINKAFNTGIINEDKLTIEYYLTVVKVLNDIIKLNFKRQYIVEFADTILKKPKKLKSLLNIINNSAIQDKICLKMKYEQFIAQKESVYELMREGYRFAIILDNSFGVSYKNMESLESFKYIIINKNLKNYDDIIKNIENKKNIIEI